jgi:hypothetical protein
MLFEYLKSLDLIDSYGDKLESLEFVFNIHNQRSSMPYPLHLFNRVVFEVRHFYELCIRKKCYTCTAVVVLT